MKITYTQTYGEYIGKLYEFLPEEEREKFINELEVLYASIEEEAKSRNVEPPPRSILSEMMPKDDRYEQNLKSVFESMLGGGSL